ncbi:unknown protein [Seminavis robusta]|uniref:Uncharacterized protein n=1 Tax=Seminavis robusta TaxID=568900 RepID=A0A9N8DNM5_9STRA|nr:unknown protein [Seminavis robusta]|eukprot:Sro238_g095710.1 n/a (313) ;mRNA; r:85126-86064
MTKRKGNLQSGDAVKERAKPGRHGVILRHDREDGKKHQWIVEFTNADGSKSEEPKGSRALQAIDPVQANINTNDEANEPPVVAETNEPPVVATTSDDEQPAIPATPWRRPTRRAAINHAVCPTPAVQEQEPAPARASTSSSSSVSSSRGPDFDWTTYQPPDSDNDDQSSNGGFPQPPDQLSEEEQSLQEEDEATNNEQPMPHLNDLEEDVIPGEENHVETEEEFKLQEEVYRREKAELIEEGWIVEKESARGPLDVGVRVETRSKRNYRQGTIVDRNDSKWVVHFDGYDETEDVSPQSLVQIYVPDVYERKF